MRDNPTAGYRHFYLYKKIGNNFEDAVKQILLSSPEKKGLLEKRMPSREELKKKWKLEKKNKNF